MKDESSEIMVQKIQTTTDNLAQTAIWLIIDPWQSQPSVTKDSVSAFEKTFKDNKGLCYPAINAEEYLKECTYQNNINHYHCVKIKEYMQRVKTKYTVLNDRYEMSDVFKETGDAAQRKFPTFEHSKISKYIKDFDTIVYVGFHHGRCTIDRKDSGAEVMSKTHKIYFKKDLLCLMPGDSWIEMDEKSKKYGTLI